MRVEIVFSSGLEERESSKLHGCTIVGQHENLKCIKYDDISCKFPPAFREDVSTDYICIS